MKVGVHLAISMLIQYSDNPPFADFHFALRQQMDGGILFPYDRMGIFG
jgi:hypothetical protein